MNIGRNIRDLRTQAGLSQVELAARAGITQGRLSVLESRPDLRGSEIVKLAAALNVSPAEILVETTTV
jgi:transcriptional regulator with XRE-family HTH domain